MQENFQASRRRNDEMVYMGDVLSRAQEAHRKMTEQAMENIRFTVGHQLGELAEAVDTRLGNIERLLQALLEKGGTR